MVCGWTPIFFFNDTATTEIYTLSLHDALPISSFGEGVVTGTEPGGVIVGRFAADGTERSEEHTSELQSQSNLVCRLLLEKKIAPSPHNAPRPPPPHPRHRRARAGPSRPAPSAP